MEGSRSAAGEGMGEGGGPCIGKQDAEACVACALLEGVLAAEDANRILPPGLRGPLRPGGIEPAGEIGGGGPSTTRQGVAGGEKGTRRGRGRGALPHLMVKLTALPRAPSSITGLTSHVSPASSFPPSAFRGSMAFPSTVIDGGDPHRSSDGTTLNITC